jgi:hypothetical protein
MLTITDFLYHIFSAVPKDMDYHKVLNDIKSIPGVKSAHSLALWALTVDKNAVMVHISVGKASLVCQRGVSHTEIQINNDFLFLCLCREMDRIWNVTFFSHIYLCKIGFTHARKPC